MFDFEMVQSYIAYLREEGVRAILSSRSDLSRKSVEALSLPIVSLCYFSAESASEREGWDLLFRLDHERKNAVVGNDIFRNPKSDIFLEKNKIYREAENLIEAVWPEYFQLIRIIEPRLAQTTKDDPFESASDPKTFGQILYRMDSDCPVKWAEILVHELGHHYLNIVITTHEEQDVFDQPWDETKYSAIRDTDRPLIGIYHGAFAQACMLGLALRILKQDGDNRYRAGAERILKRFQPTFEKDYQTILDRDLLRFDEHITEIIETVRGEVKELEIKVQPRKAGAR